MDSNKQETNNTEKKPTGKKRGRKPKIRTPEELLELKNKVKKKRGRKPKEKYNFDNQNLNANFFNDNNENESIIVRLPINSNKETIDPLPFDPLDNYSSIFSDNKEKEDKRQISMLLKNKYINEEKIELLRQLVHCNKLKKWPEKTSISCFWCCCQFNNTPWGIPKKYEDGLFTLYGIFCSPNCAASQLFEIEDKSDIKWEMYSLLNFLYFKVYGELKEIMLAPSKLCLKKFGGVLSIEEFRDKNKLNDKIYTLKFPPTISIIPSIEELCNKKIEIKDNNYIPIDKNRIKKANQEFKLKRSKPINNSKNTLDNCMNITIN